MMRDVTSLNVGERVRVVGFSTVEEGMFTRYENGFVHIDIAFGSVAVSLDSSVFDVIDLDGQIVGATEQEPALETVPPDLE